MERVIEIFYDISAVPRSSGDREKIADFCMNFAAAHGIEGERDEANNVILRKKASPGYEKTTPLILQGHLDMVCQKDAGVEHDFAKDGLRLCREGDFLFARGTTLGADNGIAVAMALAILEREDVPHPDLEVLLTADEEIGMLGAVALDKSRLKGRTLINLDAEEEDAVTVSCAGGSDLHLFLPVERENCAAGKFS